MTDKPKAGQIVWVACRATPDCEGKSARIEILFPQSESGGRTTRYICLTCNRPFHITF